MKQPFGPPQFLPGSAPRSPGGGPGGVMGGAARRRYRSRARDMMITMITRAGKGRQTVSLITTRLFQIQFQSRITCAKNQAGQGATTMSMFTSGPMM